MNIQELETFRGLVKSSDINTLRLLKRSSSKKFFEDATYFTKAILKNLILILKLLSFTQVERLVNLSAYATDQVVYCYSI